MSKEQNINRRNFLKTAGGAGLASLMLSPSAFAEDANRPETANDPNTVDKTQEAKLPQVPRKKLGKTGAKVASLALGGSFNFLENQVLLNKSLEWGVNYWDTARSYSGGNSERGIGKFFAKYPKKREKVFLVTKASGAKSVDEVEQHFQESLKRMNTNYIDLYYGIHGLSDPKLLTEELKAWAQSAKKRKLIKFFGFSTHSNMAACLAAAAKLDWIDAIMTTYNFREMQKGEMKKAVGACQKAGIGLVAMKTQGKGPFESPEDKEFAERFLKKGFTEHQIKLKAVWQDEAITSICSSMPNVAVLLSNVAAVLDKAKLTKVDKDFLGRFAEATSKSYCAGCESICSSACPQMPYVRDVARYLMYYKNYGEKMKARSLFSQLPADIKARLTRIDYSLAEAKCPQQLAISKLMAEAARVLA